jgi:glucose/arabinose dehydrogenase
VRKRTGRILALVVLGGGMLAAPVLAAAPASAATDFQAENATIVNGVVESNHTGFTGTGFVNYDNVAGGYVEFTVPASSAGTQSLQFRFANGTTTARPMDISVNGTVVSRNLSFQATGAWTTWATRSVNAALRQGSNLVRATATGATGGPNLDRLRVDVPVDDQAPTAPGQPRCSNITSNSLTLTWGASTDNVGVAGYDIYHDGTLLDTSQGTGTTHNLTGLQPNFTYRLSVFARDAAGNVSGTSPLATCVTTGGTNPPTQPGPARTSNVTQTTVNVTWGASTDNTGVAAYLVREQGSNAVLATVTGSPPATTVQVTNLACESTHQVHVVARDTEGNLSTPSTPSPSFTMGACSGGGTPGTPSTVVGGWDVPWAISWLPDGQSALVTERDTFRVYRVPVGGGSRTLVGTVPNSVTTSGEGGLMGVAVPPNWNGGSVQEVFFMHTSNDGGTTQNRIVRMNFNGSSLSGRTVILGGIRSSRFHNGGQLKFGPDGFLYATTGDSQQPNLAQNDGSLNGKILRLTRTGAAAPGNPGGQRWISKGHRNPQGIAWDSAGRLWQGEFGNATRDEVNQITFGGNYGWPRCEGSLAIDANLQPTGAACNFGTQPKWERPVAQCSCAGMDIVGNHIFFGALRGTRLWSLQISGTSIPSSQAFFVGTFGRIRLVSKVPGANAIWFGTSNSDNNGNGSADNIRRSTIS